MTLHIKIARFRALALFSAVAAPSLIAFALAQGQASAAAAATGRAGARVGVPAVTLTPAGPVSPRSAHQAQGQQPLTPAQIHTAYALPQRGARAQTIAIISAYDDPHVEADLAAYDKHFGLRACTTQNRCLHKLNQDGKPSPLPIPDADATGGMWNTESALGTEIAHAVCQSCSIMLVEATDAIKIDFSQAVAAAAAAGARTIVTTFVPTEDVADSDFARYYSNPRAAVVAATGDALPGIDWGYTGELNFPSSLPNVLAVGGTQLRTGRRAGEQAWKGTVSGCSLYFHPASWQTNATAKKACGTQRAGADIAAMATPGAIVHITGSGQSGGPWFAATGTSLAAPIIGGVIGLAGSVGGHESQMLYQRARSDPGAFHDIVRGANAANCPSPICKAGPGWDGPTGLGTPNGLEAFLPGGPKLATHNPRIIASAPRNQLRLGKNWVTHVRLGNGNAFRVSGGVVLRRTLTIGGRLRLIRLASASFRLGPLGSSAAALTIAKQYRPLLQRRGSLTVYVRVTGRGAAGSSATVQRKLTLRAP